jgi:hypothetical protein
MVICGCNTATDTGETMILAIPEPLPPNDPMHLSRPVLCQDDRAPWIGQKATGPHRATGLVHRVYSTATEAST